MKFKIGFLFLVPADLALIYWLKAETLLNDLTYGNFVTSGYFISDRIKDYWDMESILKYDILQQPVVMHLRSIFRVLQMKMHIDEFMSPQ